MGIFSIDIISLNTSMTSTETLALKDASGNTVIINSSEVPSSPKIGDTRTSFSVKRCYSDSK